MNTPICDFVKKYISSSPVRLHMPGHKGKSTLGFEPFDITEIDGADDLMLPSGIIAQSEAEASRIFNSHTFYSAGGSTLCIQVMLYLIAQHAVQSGKKPKVLAGRNAHKAFVNACALLDIEIEWIYPEESDSYISCTVCAESIAKRLAERTDIVAVYITSPDYLGNMQNIRQIAHVCHECGALLAVDNAHGAYLKFLSESLHPIDLGADICCDSAHKTLNVITGGAYLHVSYFAPRLFYDNAKSAFSVFGSSSPSYLILQSLDAANAAFGDFRIKLSAMLDSVSMLKSALEEHGFTFSGDEPMKLCITPKPFGYTGNEIAAILEKASIYPEFYDADNVVLMFSPWNEKHELDKLLNTLCSVNKKEAILTSPPRISKAERAMSLREAMLSPSERIDTKCSLGRISAAAAIGCPPAIPIVIMGERINEATLKCFEYYGIESCTVVKQL